MRYYQEQSFLSKVKENVYELWPVYGIVLVILALLIFMVYVMKESHKETEKQKAAFMAECLEYQKQYECVAMWRSGESNDNTTVVPMPVYIGR